MPVLWPRIWLQAPQKVRPTPKLGSKIAIEDVQST